MEQPPTVLPLASSILVCLLLWGTLTAWVVVGGRIKQRKPLLRVEPQRDVPWRGIDLLAILVVHTMGGLVLLQIALAVFGPEATRSVLVENPSDLQRSHELVRVLSEASWPVIVACVVMAVVIAPITEEFLFRLLLQGWLEKVDRRLRPRWPALGRLFRWGTLPVLTASFLFASLHYRGEVRQYDTNFLLFLMAGNALVTLFTVAVAVAMMRWVRGATWADLGWVPRRFLSDVVLGLVSFMTIAMPIYSIQIALTSLLPKEFSPDPITLFFFALVLGTLYLRTHRIVPSIVAHMALNASSLLLLWASC
ncbi:MAG: CPBP family intramembrane metalloprotease [Pirellulales bacterium]|nr:CPBP family intramembrane metalloprotease [Pirellulales bacterium]